MGVDKNQVVNVKGRKNVSITISDPAHRGDKINHVVSCHKFVPEIDPLLKQIIKYGFCNMNLI